MRNEPQEAERHAGKKMSTEDVHFETFIEALERERLDPAAIAQRSREDQFLETRIFRDLNIMSPAWDSSQIVHFNANDFLIVLERAAKAGVTVCGVEAFTSNGEDLGLNIPLGDGDLTHLAFVQSLSGHKGASFCASCSFEGIDLEGTDPPPFVIRFPSQSWLPKSSYRQLGHHRAMQATIRNSQRRSAASSFDCFLCGKRLQT